MASLVIAVSSVLVLSCGHTHTHTQTYADERFTLVSVSNKIPRRVSVTVRESYGFGLGLTGACLDLHS